MNVRESDREVTENEEAITGVAKIHDSEHLKPFFGRWLDRQLRKGVTR